MSFIPTRHPYTYAADWLRDLGIASSRAEAAGLKSKIAAEIGEDELWVASVFSEAYQTKELGRVFSEEESVPQYFAQKDPDVLKEAIGRAVRSSLSNWDRDAKDLATAVDQIHQVFMDRCRSFRCDHFCS